MPDTLGPGPGPLPDPPATLHARSLPIYTIDPLHEGSWIRLYSCEHASALYFGQNRSARFDDPEGKYGIFYAGIDVQCAFIETFGDSRNDTGELEIKEEDFGKKCLALITLTRPLRLVDLTGPGLANIGADGRLCAGDDYLRAQRWSRALWSHPEQPDGIYYPARHDLSRLSIAVFHRSADGVAETPRGSLASDQNRKYRLDILRTYRVNLI